MPAPSDIRLAIAAGADQRSALNHSGARAIYDDSKRQVPGLGALPSSVCAGITKEGKACSASPAKDTPYCQGHLRQMGQ